MEENWVTGGWDEVLGLGDWVSYGPAGCCTPSPPRRSGSVSCWSPTASLLSVLNASEKGGGKEEKEEVGSRERKVQSERKQQEREGGGGI